MRINPVHKHWAYVVGEFESAIAKQNTAMDAMDTVDDYESGKMRALTDGLHAARSKKKDSRLDFFKQPARNKHRALISFLEHRAKEIHADEKYSGAFKAGMIDMMRNWVVEEKTRITYPKDHGRRKKA